MARHVAFVAGMLALLLARPLAQQPGRIDERSPRDAPTRNAGGTIRGRVTGADNGQPLRKAQVRLTSIGAGRLPTRFENQVTTTDAQGRFEFAELPAGRYQLRAMKGGYVSLEYGQRRPIDAAKPIELLATQTIEKIDFALPRGAVIAGRVFDEFGEASANVSVMALRFQYDGKGRRRLTSTGSATTNDLGEFRMFALPPGDYYLSVHVGEVGDSIDRAAYAPLYYPGTTDVNLAERLTVASGQTVANLTLTLQTVRTARVSGTATDAEGKPMPGFMVVSPLGAKVAGMDVLTTIVQPDGSFAVGGLTPGEYRFVARGVPMLGSSESVTASATVAVGTSDIAGLRVVAGKPVIAAGKVVVTGDPRAARQVRRSTLRVIAAPDDDSMDFSFHENDGIPVNDDGSFQIALEPGRTRLLVIGMPPEWDMKAVRVGGVDVTDAGIDVKPAEDLSGLEIELTDRINETIGLVTNERNEPVKDYLVVIFSKDRQKWSPQSRAVRSVRSDQDGRFTVGGLPSGEYFAYATDFIEPGQEHDVEFLDRIQPLATRFLLGDGETHTVNLTLHPAP